MNDVTLPPGLTGGGGWESTLQNILAYTAGRFADASSIKKIYGSTSTPMLMDTDGTLYPAGTPAPSLMRQQSLGGLSGVPVVVWLLGAGLLAVFLLKD